MDTGLGCSCPVASCDLRRVVVVGPRWLLDGKGRSYTSIAIRYASYEGMRRHKDEHGLQQLKPSFKIQTYKIIFNFIT